MTRRVRVLLPLLLASTVACVAPAAACPVCDSGTGEQVRAGIAEDGAAVGLVATLAPFAVTAGVVAAVYFAGGAPGRGGATMPAPEDRRPLVSAGMLLGVGLGGFVDGIVFHQLLQTHNMLSARRPPTTVANLEINMFWDGLFHAFTWLATAAGVALLFRAGRRPEVPWSGRVLLGAMLAGWGTFNLVEGVIDHHVLHVHHVVERLGPSVWDWAFLGFGLVLILSGMLMIRSHSPRPPDVPPALGAG